MALTAGLTACASTPESGTDDVVEVAFFSPVAANVFTAAAYEGVRSVVEADGGKVTMFDAGFDQNTQISQMEDAIVTGKYDAFIVMPVNGAVLVAPTQEAIEAGIVVVANWNNIGPDLDSIDTQVEGLTAVVAGSLSTQGTVLAEEVVRACEGDDDCVAVYMPGNFQQATEKLRMEAFEAVIAEHAHITINISAEGGYLAETALNAATDVLQAIPNIDVFATPDDPMTVGVVQAIENADMLGQVKVISAGASKAGIQLVRDGKVFSDLIILPETEGRTSATLALQALHGDSVRNVNSFDLSPIGMLATEESLNTPEGLKFTGEY